MAEVWLRAVGERAALEYRLVGSIVSDPARGLALADIAGVSWDWFIDDELQTVYLATLVNRQLGRLTGDRDADQLAIADLARKAWPEPWLSDRVNRFLEEVFDSEFTPLFVPRFARLLSDLSTCQRDAVEHIRYAWKLLDKGVKA